MPTAVFAFFDVSDRGADQAARKRRTAELLQTRGSILYVQSDCFLHNFHNAVKNGLQLVDASLACFSPETLKGFKKYFGSIAKVANLWREKAKAFMESWDTEAEATGASNEVRALGRRYPVNVVAGRWGSIEEGEDFLLQRGPELTIPVTLRVLSSSMKASTLVGPESLPVASDLRTCGH